MTLKFFLMFYLHMHHAKGYIKPPPELVYFVICNVTVIDCTNDIDSLNQALRNINHVREAPIPFSPC
jgi:hypothetical protein